MHFDGFVIVLMASIMVIGGGILIAMLALESPWWNLGARRSPTSPPPSVDCAGGSVGPGHEKKSERRKTTSGP